MLLNKLLILFLALICGANTSNILCFFVTYSKSHLIIHLSVAKALVERGHNVTVVTSVDINDPNPGYRFVKLNEFNFRNQISTATSTNATVWTRISNFIPTLKFIIDSTSKATKEPPFQKIMNEEKFDLILLGYFMNDYHLGLAQHFKCPIIVVWMIQPWFFINNLVGNPSEVLSYPNVFLAANRPMNFIDRLKNVLTYFLELLLQPIINYVYTMYYDDLFPPDRYPSFEVAKKNVSLILCNHHLSDGPVRANVPAIVEIGGIQIKPKPDPLPKDIDVFLQKSKERGAIFFSLGSNVHTTDLLPETVNIIYKVLSSLKQNVLWKWEDPNNTPGKSPNIMFKKWLPQDDILAHPNIKLFITHGGKGSVIESEYHGVPMVGLPIFGDQPMNIDAVVSSGFGLGLDYNKLTEEDFRKAINEVLQNSTYRENVKRYSILYRDRPMTARESAVYWVEYVLRHHGAPHLQSQAVHLNTIQYFGLDVMALFAAVIFIWYKLTKITIKMLWSRCKGKKQIEVKKGKSKSKVKKQ